MNSEIDIDQIIRERAGKKARWIPRWLTRLVERLIHQDFINVFLRQEHVGVDFCEKGVEYLGVTMTVEGLENLPSDDRPCTFVSNHPLGAIDGVALGGIIGRYYDGNVKYLVNDLLMNLKGLAPLCIPINKLGSQARNFPQQVNEAFHSDNHIIMFPAGLCSRLIDGKVHDIPWRKTFISKSIETQRDVIPVHFIGENSPRFYRVARWCKRLGLKFNLAMLLLPDEMYRSRGNHYTVRFGHPIPYQTFDHSRTAAQWAQWVEDEVYRI
ncbi:MAG: 1-acyl-sn-glycerol-3-phosphate acyltransferase [Bacteroidaceae bacterium]|nr:1-acyl-sn-glycerol-3-phosphate acyltransferase [Bacteroidaceae bacterium]